ncbi:MAG: monovalent cation/H+ antiporter subunit D family protein [Yonghaparkia sp.]|nr:monovalent cation/H+ antiporter subunit D family protein [Microcella sp.]
MTAIVELLLPLVVGIPLLIGGALFAMPSQHRLRQTIGAVTLGALAAAGVTLVVLTADGSVLTHQIGIWPIGIAIPFAVDLFSALLLTVTAVITLIGAQYLIAAGQGREASSIPLLLVLAGGVSGALLTADLFNLFVFVEVMLLPSYGLLLVLSRRGSVAGARLFVTVNLLASTLFLAGVGLVYAVTGTVNLGELAGAADDPAVALAAAVMLAGIAVKAAVFPVHGWLARTYTSATPAITAIFSAVHTKAAVYVIYRVYAVMFEGAETWQPVLLAIAAVTAVVGAAAALGEGSMRSLLVFQMVSGIGVILLGVALFTPLALTAAIAYMIHHMLSKASLFLTVGAIEETYGTGEIRQLGGLRTREPLITAAFVVGALSLVGLPPFSGFVAKVAVVLGAAEAGQVIVVLTVLAVSALALVAVLLIWAGVFNGKRHDEVEQRAAAARIRRRRGLLDDDPIDGAELQAEVDEALERHQPPRGSQGEDPHDHRGTRIPVALALPAVQLAVLVVALGIGGELLLSLSATAAAGLIDITAYVEAVMSE